MLDRPRNARLASQAFPMDTIHHRISTEPLNELLRCRSSNTIDLAPRLASKPNHDLCPLSPDLLNLTSTLDPTAILPSMRHRLLRRKPHTGTRTCLSMLPSKDLHSGSCQLSRGLLLHDSLFNRAFLSNKPLHPRPTLGHTRTDKLFRSVRCLL